MGCIWVCYITKLEMLECSWCSSVCIRVYRLNPLFYHLLLVWTYSLAQSTLCYVTISLVKLQISVGYAISINIPFIVAEQRP